LPGKNPRLSGRATCDTLSPSLALGDRGGDHSDLIGVLAEVLLEQTQDVAACRTPRGLFGEKVRSFPTLRHEQHRPVLSGRGLVVLDLADGGTGADVHEVPRLAVSSHPQIEHDHARRVTHHFRDAHPGLPLLVVRVGGSQALCPRCEEVQKVFTIEVGGSEASRVPLELLVEGQLRHG